MPELIVILIAITSATSKQPNYEPIGQMRDMDTCRTVAAMLNDYTKDDPDLVFQCKEVKVAKA
jgi:hypothetical protein